MFLFPQHDDQSKHQDHEGANLNRVASERILCFCSQTPVLHGTLIVHLDCLAFKCVSCVRVWGISLCFHSLLSHHNNVMRPALVVHWREIAQVAERDRREDDQRDRSLDIAGESSAGRWTRFADSFRFNSDHHSSCDCSVRQVWC